MSEVKSAVDALLHIVHSRPGSPDIKERSGNNHFVNGFTEIKDTQRLLELSEAKLKAIENQNQNENDDVYSRSRSGSQENDKYDVYNVNNVNNGNNEEDNDEIDNSENGNDTPVQAYAKLQGDNFVYYIQSLSIIIGRKTCSEGDVQIDLGPSKIVSRHHARIEYNFTTRHFQIECLGKNGFFVNGRFFTQDSEPVQLETKTLIQIGERWFYFLLPLSTEEPKPLFEENKNFNEVKLQPTTLRHKYPLTINRSTSLPVSPYDTLPNSPASSRPTSPINDNDNDNDAKLPDYRSSDIKPPFSYATLIAQAINNTHDKRLTLSGIYSFITENYPYYQTAQNGWQNSIRHNLSLNKAFVKIARADNEPGKGAFWVIDKRYENHFSDGIYKKKQSGKSTFSPSRSRTPDRQKRHLDYAFENQEKKRAKLPRSAATKRYSNFNSSSSS